jgi:hypothetical protein
MRMITACAGVGWKSERKPEMRALARVWARVGFLAVGLVALIGVSALALSCGESCCSSTMGGMHPHGAATEATAGQSEAGHSHAVGATAAASDSAASAGFANTKCPIMGSAINPSKVTEGLTRVYKGRKIAFCCGMCPGQWDKLTDAQKDAKLQ